MSRRAAAQLLSRRSPAMSDLPGRLASHDDWEVAR